MKPPSTSPQAPISDWFLWDDMHHNGALTLPLSFNFFQVFGKERPEPTSRWGSRPQYSSKDAYNFSLELGPVKNANENFLHGHTEDGLRPIITAPSHEMSRKWRNI